MPLAFPLLRKPCAIVLLAHGSRDPQWRQPIEAIAARIRANEPSATVVCAYLEMCEPRLEGAVAALIEAGAKNLRVFPLFLGLGKHAREDLPILLADIQQAHPHVALELLPTVGENEHIVALMADIALQSL